MKKIFSVLLSLQLICAPLALADGETTNPDAFRETGNASAKGYEFYLQQVEGLGGGIIGSQLFNCNAASYTFSHYVFMAGALANFASEVAGAFEKNNFNEREKESLKMSFSSIETGAGLPSGIATGTYNGTMSQEEKDAHLTMLEEAKKGEEDNLKFIKSRVTWATVVEVIYIAAAASAAAEVVLYALQEYTGYTDWSLNNCDTGKLSEPMVLGIATAYGFLPKVLKALNGEDIGGEIVAAGLSGIGFFMLLKQFSKQVAKVVDKGVSIAPLRIVTFGVFAALAVAIAEGLKERQRIAEDNINKIQKVIDSIKGTKTPDNVIAGNDDGDDNSPNGNGPDQGNGPKKGTIKPLAQGNPKKNNLCFGHSSNQVAYSQDACKSPYKFNRSNLKFGQIPLLQNTSLKALDVAESLAANDMATAEMHGADLVANAAKIRKLKDELLVKANEELKKKGQAPIDFNKAIKEQYAAMASSVHALSKSQGFAPNGASVSTQLPLAAVDSQTPVVNTASVKPVTPAKGPVDPFAGLSSASSDGADASGPIDTAASFAQYDLKEEDISKKSDVSIFKQLSNRYLLNYNKIFNRPKEANRP